MFRYALGAQNRSYMGSSLSLILLYPDSDPGVLGSGFRLK